MNWDCHNIQEKLYAYLDGELTPEETACFLSHLQHCPQCQALVEETQSIEDGIFAALQVVEPPQDFSKRVMAALPQTMTQPQKSKAKLFAFPKKRLWTSFGTVAAAAVLVMAFAITGPDTALTPTEQPGSSIIGPSIAENPSQVEEPANLEESTDQDPGAADETSEQTADRTGQTNLQVAENQPATTQNSGSSQSTTSETPTTNQQETGVDSQSTDNTPQPQGEPNTASMALPKAAYGVQAEGTLSARLLASFENEDIFTPSISSNRDSVSYYTQNEQGVYLWSSSLTSAQEPQCLGLAENSTAGTATALKNSCPVYDTNTALFSPDGSMMAMNQRGNATGVWIANVGTESTPWRLCGEGGGKLLAWAPNSSKLLFTDNEDKLYVGYPTEKRIFIVTEHAVKDIVWGKDSKTVVLVVQEPGKAHTSLYTVQIP